MAGCLGSWDDLEECFQQFFRRQQPAWTPLPDWLRALSGGQSTVSGETATRCWGWERAPLSPIFQAAHANCFSQASVPWLVEEESVKRVRITIPVILGVSEYVSLGTEFIASAGRRERALRWCRPTTSWTPGGACPLASAADHQMIAIFRWTPHAP